MEKTLYQIVEGVTCIENIFNDQDVTPVQIIARVHNEAHITAALAAS